MSSARKKLLFERNEKGRAPKVFLPLPLEDGIKDAQIIFSYKCQHHPVKTEVPIWVTF